MQCTDPHTAKTSFRNRTEGTKFAYWAYDHGPFHHLSQKLEEITSRKEKGLHTRQPVPTPTLWEHSSLSLKNTQGIKYKYTDLSEINKL